MGPREITISKPVRRHADSLVSAPSFIPCVRLHSDYLLLCLLQTVYVLGITVMRISESTQRDC